VGFVWECVGEEHEGLFGMCVGKQVGLVWRCVGESRWNKFGDVWGTADALSLVM
jgi:hypothetical protein